MSTIATQPLANPSKSTSNLALKVAASAAIGVVAIFFVLRYVFRYYLNYNEASFTDPIRGAANYWAMRGTLLMHITGGMVALLAGPSQFWTGFRVRYARLHRFFGYMFLGGVTVGAFGAVRMAIHTTFGWPATAWLLGLAFAWVTTTGMAYYAILRRCIAVHKEWMVRAYVVTFAFVTFRLLNDYPPLSRIGPDSDRSNMIGWACWAIPLLITEVVLQLRRMRKPV
jgi:hypothetical protein